MEKPFPKPESLGIVYTLKAYTVNSAELLKIRVRKGNT
jgi:hypothetical protein